LGKEDGQGNGQEDEQPPPAEHLITSVALREVATRFPATGPKEDVSERGLTPEAEMTLI
jgi:hypothetical protein